MTNEITLPELPDPDYQVFGLPACNGDVYNADSMRAYALAAVEEDRKSYAAITMHSIDDATAEKWHQQIMSTNCVLSPIDTNHVVIPAGHKLVPIQPTKEMIEAARDHYEGAGYYLPYSLYQSMINAAPEYKPED